MKILIIEDNRPLIDAITKALSAEQFLCETALDFPSASEKAYIFTYDVVVVDINLPGGGSGLDIIREVKQANPNTGVIIISARDSLDHKIEGLELGADDYLTKPFDTAELIARIRALIRRRNFAGNPTIRFGQLFIHPDSREVLSGDARIDLTRSEYDLLLFFLSNPTRVLSRQALAEHIWGDNSDLADSFDFIYSHIKNLRKKIMATGAPDPIKAVYGIGYKLAAP
ncbi:MAG: response regulator transcription factor [Saprospiraceae bacterium]